MTELIKSVELNVLEIQNELRVDSKTVSELLDIKHKNLISTIRKYLTEIEEHFGRVAFETAPLITNGGIQDVTIAYLTEGQAIYVSSLSNNTDLVRTFKAKLVKAFLKVRESLLIQKTPKTYLEALKELVLVIEDRDKTKQTLQLKEEKLKEESEKVEVSLKIIEEYQPKVEMYDALVSSEGSVTLLEAANILEMGGRTTLIKRLKELKILQNSATNRVIPYSYYAKEKWFITRENAIIDNADKPRLVIQTFVTPLGIDKLRKKLKSLETIKSVEI